MKKCLSTILTFIFVIAVLAAMIFIMQYITSRPENNSSDLSESASEAISDNSSEDTNSIGNNSNTSSQSVPEDTVVSFLACPDNIIHPSVYNDAIARAAAKNGTTPDYSNPATAEYDFYQIYQFVADEISTADLSYINVETMIGGDENPIAGFPTFNTPKAAGDTLYNLGFDVYNLAHNHMLDSYSDKFLINCHKFFSDKGVDVIGYYEDEAATDNIVIVEKEGIKIAFLAYTYGTNGLALQSGASTYIPYFNENLIKKQVALAKEQANLVIVSAHWGNEDTYTPNSYQQSYAQLLVDLGVDVILGMHPHVIQPMKWVENNEGHKTLLIYSMGNFVSGMQDGFNLLGGMLGFDIIKDAETAKIYIDNVIFKPIVTHYTKPGKGYNSHDTGYRNFTIYHLENYTDELAALHDVNRWDLSHRYTLVGGKFSKQNLINTVKEIIPAEFLSEYYQ
ncbi:MAG TPA: capsule biosynthesis protein CapA [Clostridiales bacterium]|nr:capsule biosynthesis protein CapA [Clostridiales bacterium]